MAPTPPSAKSTTARAKANLGGSGEKAKEKLFHPLSRRAGQLERKHLRKNKLAVASVKRTHAQREKNERNVFFKFAMPPDAPCLTLAQIHDIIRDTWLPRHDALLELEPSSRRKGRPRSLKEENIIALKVRELDEYRTGLEIPDLTHEPTVEFLRKWEDADPSYLHLLRFIRVSSTAPEQLVIVSRGINERTQEGTVSLDDRMELQE